MSTTDPTSPARPVSARTPWTSFELERWQSDWEHQVEINLADSGVAPVRLGELLDGYLGADLMAHPIHYPEVNGTVRLRERIAALYPGATPEQVLVTVGAAEANSILVQTLVGPGDRVVVMQPGYQQVRGLAANLGATVADLSLRSEDHWRPDLDELRHTVQPGTALVSVNSPNNPTGTILRNEELTAIAEQAERSGAWLHADEVYRGSELDGSTAPTAWGRGERVVVVGSLSKAYGLSGLRIGWLVAPEDLVAQLWRRHEYATISAASLSMQLAEVALTEPHRTKLLHRQQELARTGRATLLDWVHAHPDLVTLDPPASTALGFPRLLRHPDSVAAATAIRDHASVLVAPGLFLGAEGHIRISHALDPARTAAALDRIAAVLRGSKGRPAPANP